MQIAENVDKWLIIHQVAIPRSDHRMSSLAINVQYLSIVDGTQSWLSPTVATRESSTETTNRLKWYGTRPIMACAFSKYVWTIRGRWSKLNSPLMGVRSTPAHLTCSNGVPVGMMWLTANLCQRDVLSHGLNSQIDGFDAIFNVEHRWACNEACTCSLSQSPVGSLVSSIFWWSTPKYALYPTFLKRHCT
jgi:hypothetical protein